MKQVKKRIFSAILALVLVLASLLSVSATAPVQTAGESAAPGELPCRSAILMDAKTGEVLFEQNPDEALPPDKLKDADDSKAQADGNGNESQPICDRVCSHMYACQLMKPKVEGRKADLCPVWARRLYVNTPNQCRPQQKRDQKTDSRPQA